MLPQFLHSHQAGPHAGTKHTIRNASSIYALNLLLRHDRDNPGPDHCHCSRPRKTRRLPRGLRQLFDNNPSIHPKYTGYVRTPSPRRNCTCIPEYSRKFVLPSPDASNRGRHFNSIHSTPTCNQLIYGTNETLGAQKGHGPDRSAPNSC